VSETGPTRVRWTRRLLRPIGPLIDRYRAQYRRHLAVKLRPLLEDATSVLDVGCDDGVTSELIAKRNGTLRIEGVDVQTVRPCRIPRVIYDGRHLPFDDRSFDVVMALDVLHHTRCIPELITEMARVSRRMIVIKDHCVQGPVSRLAVALGDWITNAPYGIACPYNYPTIDQWERYFALAGLEIVEMRQDLGLNPGTNRQNPLFRLRRRHTA